jgi:hypothetical protein
MQLIQSTQPLRNGAIYNRNFEFPHRGIFATKIVGPKKNNFHPKFHQQKLANLINTPRPSSLTRIKTRHSRQGDQMIKKVAQFYKNSQQTPN